MTRKCISYIFHPRNLFYLSILTSALLELKWLGKSLRKPLVLRLHLRPLLQGIEIFYCSKPLPFNVDLRLDPICTVQYVFSFAFSALAFITLYHVQAQLSLSTKASSSYHSSVKPPMSLANHRLVIILSPKLTFLSYSSRAGEVNGFEFLADLCKNINYGLPICSVLSTMANFPFQCTTAISISYQRISCRKFLTDCCLEICLPHLSFLRLEFKPQYWLSELAFQPFFR